MHQALGFTRTLFVTGVLALGAVLAGPPCSSERPNVVCSPLIRPFSDNSYFWSMYCGETAAPGALMADSFVDYDAETGTWYARFPRCM